MDNSSAKTTTLPSAKLELLDLLLKKKGIKPSLEQPISRRENFSPCSLSFAQQRLWFLDQLTPNNVAYSIPAIIRLSGTLHLCALQQTFTELLRRHESLRTSFAVVDSQPVQLIGEPQPFHLPVTDLSHLESNEREQMVQQLASEEAALPFDLTVAPLLRARLLRLSEGEHVLLVTMHHIVSDGWSMGVLIREVAALYTAFSEGKPSPLPELPIQYADYAMWQRERLQGSVLEEQLSYWREQLAGTPAVLELPTDRVRPTVQSYRGGAVKVNITEETTSRLKQLSQREGCTLFMLMLAAFDVLLYRYTGQEDVVVGSPVAGRVRAEVEGLIGFFVNTLALRVDIGGNPSFRELLGRVREVSLGGYAHQEVAFEKLVEELQPTREMSHSPVFQVMMILQNTPVEALELPGLKLSYVGDKNTTAKFDLTLSLSEEEDEVRGWLEYNADLFDEATVERMARHFESLVENIAADPESRIADLALLGDDERYQILRSWNDTQRDYQPQCIHELFEAQVERTPDAVALIFEDEKLSYRELNERANQLARHLQGMGVGPESLVGIMMERSIEMIVSLLAVLKAGGAYVPLDPRYPQERLAFMLEDARAAVLLTQERLTNSLQDYQGRVVRVDAEWERVERHSVENLSSAATPENLAYVIYTSGSTGRPKGVLGKHGACINRFAWMWEQYPFERDEVCCQKTSLSFVDSIWEIFGPLLQGVPLLLIPDEVVKDPVRLVEALASGAVTRIVLVPSLLRAILEAAKGDCVPRLRYWVSSGEALSRELAERFRERMGERCLINLYGSSEVCADATYYETPQHLEQRSVPIGRPIANTEVFILDDQKQPVPVGVIGEIYVGGAGLARGYLNRPDLTAEKFVPHPYSVKPGAMLYRTGDLGRYLSDGNIEYLGRSDYQVKVRGIRIEPGEIETALNDHPAVRGSVVMLRDVVREGVPDGEARLVAYVLADEAHGGQPAELRSYLRERLPEHMIPAHFLLLEALPLTPNGKVDRRALPAPDLSMSGTAADVTVAPRTLVEELIASLWSEVLGVRRVGVEDSFFELGGHSLLATQVVSRVREAFKVEIALRQMFEEPTVAGLAARVEAAMSGGRSLQAEPIRRVKREDELPLSFSQQRLWILDQLEPGNPVYNIPIAIRLTGQLHLSAFRQTFTELLHRHESLRTSFSVVDSQPVQLISPSQPFHLPVTDLSHLSAEERERMVQRLATEEAELPFDLTIAPLMRARLLRLTEGEHVLLVTMHHIVSDGWSMGVLIREVTALYATFSKGEPSPLPELPIQYADYAAWQRGRLSGEVLDEQLSYWREQLQGAPTMLELPTDRARPDTQSTRGARHTLTLDGLLSDELRRLSRRHGATLFMTLLAAFQVLLYRYTGQEDVVVGTPIANRNRAETEGLIGFFVNTLALRVKLGGNPTFKEALERVREMCLGAYAHQDVPFEALIAELQPERDLSHTPIFQVMFNMLNLDYAGGHIELDGLTVDAFPAQEVLGSRFDLTLYAREQADEIHLELIYSDLFTPLAMERLLEHFQALLQAIAAHPEQRLATLPLLTDHERERQRHQDKLARPVNPFIAFAREEIEQTIQARFEQQVRSYPEKIAVKTRKQSWTYEELNKRANRIARALLETTGGGEQRIALLFKHDAPLLAGMLGVLKAGKTYVPLDTVYPEQRLLHILKDSEAAALLTDNANHLRAEAPVKDGLPVINLDRVDSDTPGDNLQPQGSPDTLAYILYTSGSTGQPKGVVQNHRNVLHHIRSYTNNLHICANDKLTLLSSYAFDAAVMDIFGALLNGATLCPIDLRDEELSLLSKRLIEEEITIYHSTPTVYRYFVNSLRDEETCPNVRLVVLGGEEVQKRDWELYKKHFSPLCLFVNGLGPTESTVSLQYFVNRQTEITHHTVPVGYAVEDTEVSLFNEAGEQVAIYGVGEIVVKSPHVALGYWRQPELTQRAFLTPSDKGNWRSYRTGDLGRWQTNGQIEYVGRRDDQVKLRGHRIELGEVEAALRACPGVRQCAVVPRTGDDLNQQLVAYVLEREEEASASVSQWREQLGERLPEYMIPSVFVKIEEMPLTASGKVDRRALPAVEAGREMLGSAYAAPSTAVEEMLVGIWCEVLKVERVGVLDNFFELGGHSLLATQVVARIRQLFPVEIALRSIFERPTIAGLAELIELQMGNGKHLDALPIQPIKREGFLPLSFSQQRLWFLDQLEPGNVAYNIPAAIRLLGSLHLHALQQTFTELLRRHESLRTSFAVVDSQPVQLIGEPQTFHLPVTDLSHLAAEEHEQIVQQLASEEATLPFDLTVAPLMRGRLLKLKETEHVLLVTMHHIVSDGWSMGILIREVAALYTAFSEGKPSPLEELPIQYADYAVWQRERLSGAVLEEQLSYWREQLAGAPAVLELPTDRVRPSIQSYRGGAVRINITEETTNRLKQLSQREGCTLFMLMLAAFDVLLYRYTGQEDVVVGSPVAGRVRAEVEGLIGFFVNTLALRVKLGGNPTFKEALERVREVCLGGYAHQEVAFEKLVEELQPTREMSHSPVFQVMMVLQNAPRAELQLPGLKLQSVESHNESAKFDLTLSMWETDEGMEGRLEFNGDLFERASIERMAGHFQVLLDGIVTNPEQQVADLPLLTEGEQHQLLKGWNDTQREYPVHCLHELFEQQVERTPEAIALVFADQELSYRELNERANQLAHHLQGMGVRAESLVGIMMERSIEMVVSLLAVLKAGGAYVPLDPEYPRERLSFMLSDSGVSVLLTQARLTDMLPASETRTVCVDSQWSAIQEQSRENPQSSVDADNLAYVIYTSGSTGQPKGAMNTHRAISNRLLWMQEAYHLQATDVVMQKTPFSFDVSVWEFFWPLLAGARLVVARPGGHRDPAYLRELIIREGITTLHFVPSMLSVFVEEQGIEECHSIRRVICSGEALSVELQERFFTRFDKAELHNLYGPTEAAVDVTAWECERDDSRRSVPIGRAISNTRIYILDERLEAVPVGISGELYIGGVAVGRGYIGRSGMTAERYVPDPYSEEAGARMYRTGDVCRWGVDGEIEYVGRADDQVKVRGHRIELGEVEAALRACRGVSQCAVVVRSEGGAERLVAYVVRGEAEASVSQWREQLGERLPHYMIPSVLMVIEEMPLTASGKVDRRRLPEPETSRAELGKEYEGAGTEAERILVSIWEEVLKVEGVGIHDNFFELGGDSILGLQIVARANQKGLHLQPKQLFKHQTIAELAASVASGTQVLMTEQGLVTGDVPLTPIQKWFFEEQPVSPHHFNQAALFEVQEGADYDLVKRVIGHLFEHHDALRLRFVPGETGWRQFNAGLEEAVPFTLVDLSKLSADEQRESVEASAAQTQRSLHLTQGPLARVVLFEMGQGKPARLLIVVHHLAVDGMSWRILLEDLQTAYGQLSRGEALKLPRKTTSYKQWAERLEAYAVSDSLSKEASYWLDGRRRQVGKLPLDHETGANTVGSVRKVFASLDEEETRALLQEVPAAYRTKVNDALLTALAQTFARWSGERRLLVNVEGHGREEIDEAVDLSRTVGWFTTIFPVLLELGETLDVGEALKLVKEQLREIPQNGIGYGVLRYLRGDEISAMLRELPPAEVLFNYLGQFDSVLTGSKLLRVADEASGPAQSEQERRRHALEIDLSVSHGQLRMTWSYSEHLHRRATIEWLAAEYGDALRELIMHCRLPASGGFTPADFPSAKLSQKELDKFLGKFKPRGGRSK